MMQTFQFLAVTRYVQYPLCKAYVLKSLALGAYLQRKEYRAQLLRVKTLLRFQDVHREPMLI